jgi:hypothetical protein
MRLSSRKAWLTRFLALAAIWPLAASAQTAAAPDPAAEDQSDSKLEVYVECYNRLDDSAHKSIKRYESWVKNMNAGPTGMEKVVYGLYPISSGDITTCRGQFAEAQGLKPNLALDGAGAEYIKALEGLGQVVEEMHPYYDRENYKDDKFAKGKQLHVRFVVQKGAFEAASKRFSEDLDVENDKRLEAQMAALEKEEGRKLSYLNMAAVHRAKLLVRLIGEETFPLDQVAARLEAFEKIADEEIQFTKANPAGLPVMLSMFAGHLEDFRKAAKERMRRVRDKTPYDTGETAIINSNAGWMVSGSSEKIIKTYNNLIESSNRMN